MIIQKIPGAQKSSTHVTYTQLTILFLLLGIAAGVCASLVLRMQDRLRGGTGFWYATIAFGIALCAGLALSYMKFRLKAEKLLLPPKN